MKALTLTEPWASLVMLGGKTIETRSWGTDYRGSVAIHAAKGMKRDDLDFAQSGEACRQLRLHNIDPMRWPTVKAAFPRTRGCVLATAWLTDCLPTRNALRSHWLGSGESRWHLPETERAFGDYSPGRFGWVLVDVVCLPEPIPARGELGLWEWEPPTGLLESLGASS